MTILEKFRKKAESPTKLAGPGLIGLDIDAGQIHMCQIRPREHGMFTIIAKTSVSYSGTRDELLASPERLKSLIDAGFKEKSFEGRRVAALMPWDDVKIMSLTYKATVSDVDAEVVRMLDNGIEGSIEDYVVDYVPVRSGPSDEEHMVVATLSSRAKVNTLLQALIDAGLEVDSLDVAPTALRRIVSALYTGHAADNVLMINCYNENSYLTVISGRRLLFNQSVDFSERMLLERIASKLDTTVESALNLVLSRGFQKHQTLALSSVDDESDISSTLLETVKPCFLGLVEDINRVLEFTAAETHGVPVSRVCLLGSIAHWPGTQQMLFSLLDFDVPDGQIEFTQVFEDENDNTRVPWSGMFSDISIAMGLALRGLVDNEPD
jgi:Tfp pilus assembly PilM family ATPase